MSIIQADKEQASLFNHQATYSKYHKKVLKGSHTATRKKGKEVEEKGGRKVMNRLFKKAAVPGKKTSLNSEFSFFTELYETIKNSLMQTFERCIF